jgi:hypothetical protein
MTETREITKQRLSRIIGQSRKQMSAVNMFITSKFITLPPALDREKVRNLCEGTIRLYEKMMETTSFCICGYTTAISHFAQKHHESDCPLILAREMLKETEERL